MPYDASSSYLRGPAEAPALIREALHSPAGNDWSEDLRCLTGADCLSDAGDLPLLPTAAVPAQIEAGIAELLSEGARPLALGGELGPRRGEPGGLTVREVVELVQGLSGPVVGADVVELNPRQDRSGMTAVVAAKLVKELAGRMLSLHQSSTLWSWSMKRLVLSAVMCCGALTSTVSAQSIAGEWDASINTPGGARSFKIVFQVNGDTLTGTVKREAGDVPLAGTLKGSAVRFSYTVNYNGNPLELTITATATGDSMKGTVDFAGAAEDEFWAKRAAAPRPPPAS